MKEIWKDVEGFEGCYQVSNLGRVKSLLRILIRSNGRQHTVRERILISNINIQGYCRVVLHDKEKKIDARIHQLVAIAFLNHVPSGHQIVVDHIDNNKLNNRLDNIQLISQRENASKDRVISSSKYTGVYWDKSREKWIASIHFKGKKRWLGRFKSETKAHEAYRNALIKIENE